MTNMHMKKCSTALVIKEIEINITRRSTSYPLRWLKLKREKDSKCWKACRDIGTLIHSYIAGWIVKQSRHFGNSWAIT